MGSYLAMRNFVHRNTDGPDNPYSKVYSLSDVRRDFPFFTVVRAHKEFMHAPPLPVARAGLARVLGGHLLGASTAGLGAAEARHAGGCNPPPAAPAARRAL